MSDLSQIPTDQLLQMLQAHPDVVGNGQGAQTAPQPIGFLGRVAHGLRDPLDAGAQMLVNALPQGAVSAVQGVFGDKFAPNAQQLNQQLGQLENDYQGRRQASGSTGFDAGRLLGNILGTTPVAAALPMAAPEAGLGSVVGYGAGQGAAMGALQPVTNNNGQFWTDKAKQAAVGAATGGATAGALNMVGRAINPTVDDSVKYLRDRGVNLTPGQNIGDMAAKGEDILGSVNPAISIGQRRAVKDFNVAAYNEVLKPIGEQFEGAPGRDAVKIVGDKLSDAYNALVPDLKLVPDQQYAQDLADAVSQGDVMSEDAAKQFQAILTKKMPRGGIEGEPLKDLQSSLTRYVSQFGRSPDPNHQMIADALSDVRTAVTDNLARVNPEHAQQLANIDNGWANLVRLEKAAAASNDNGIFTPQGLMMAVRSADDSVRRRAIARGTGGTMQKLADAGLQVIGSKYPNSGTVTRGIVASGAMLGGAGAVNPLAAAGLASSALAYTPVGQKAVGALVNGSRGAYAPMIANGVKQLSGPAALLAALYNTPQSKNNLPGTGQ